MKTLRRILFNLGNLSHEIFVVFRYSYKTRYTWTMKLVKVSIKPAVHVICSVNILGLSSSMCTSYIPCRFILLTSDISFYREIL